MNLLNEIKNRNLIDKSLLPVIFGRLLDDTDFWFDPDYELPSLARDVSLFYFGLMQCYCFAKAQKENTSLKEIDLPVDVLTPLINIWDVDKPNTFSKDGEIFSYLIVASEKLSDPSVLLPQARECIVKVRSACEDLVADSRRFLGSYGQKNFIELLESLPLLKKVSFSENTMKITFFADANLSVRISPFISFLSFDMDLLGEPVEKVTSNCCVLTSVSKGEVNDELFFDTVTLGETDADFSNKRIGREISENENLKLLCAIAGVNTHWYSIDECWCDLKFLNKMVGATVTVILDYMGIDLEDCEEIDLLETYVPYKKLAELLNDSIYFRSCFLHHENDEINVFDLNHLLFELFLESGLFKTVRDIMLNSPSLSEASIKKMFDQYISFFVSSNTITKRSASRYESECDKKISNSLEKLSHIVSPDSEIYEKRKREIIAEWRTSYVLKAAGIKNKSLFADVETILSIDDYYDMLVNNETSPEEDLKKVLRMLCIFYESIIDNTFPFNEKKYFSTVRKIAPNYNGLEVEELFESFISIAKRIENLKHVDQLLGRKGLGEGSIKRLKHYYDSIRNAKNGKNNVYNSGPVHTATVFISYAHEDASVVRPIVERWKSQGLKLFFDETDIHDGENWQKVAEKAMDDEKCKMVIYFASKNSVKKTAVRDELFHAKVIRSDKYKNSEKRADRFIVPINLESEKLSVYLDQIAEKDPDTGLRQNAKDIRKVLDNCRSSWVEYTALSSDELDRKIRDDYKFFTNNDGRIVPPGCFTAYKLAVANFYAFLKFGYKSQYNEEQIDDHFNDNKKVGLERCIYPIVASVKEAKIKRDNIAIAGYELIRGKGRSKTNVNYILTSRTLDVDDYYCIPKYRNAVEAHRQLSQSVQDKKYTMNLLSNWIVEPLLIKCDPFIEILNQAREKDNG